jgi:GT2 family glycosyltransferase
MAVTGACLMVAKRDYLDVGGFDTAYRVDYSDVDFCLRLRERKGRIVFTPHARLYHFESRSKDAAPMKDSDVFRTRWREVLERDPFCNRQLSPDHSRLSVALPARSLVAEYSDYLQAPGPGRG